MKQVLKPGGSGYSRHITSTRIPALCVTPVLQLSHLLPLLSHQPPCRWGEDPILLPKGCPSERPERGSLTGDASVPR